MTDLYQITLELCDVTEQTFIDFLKDNANKILLSKHDMPSCNGHDEYTIVANANLIVEFLECFYDEGIEFFVEHARSI